MKLVAIMSVEEYARVLERLYEEHRVPVFSEVDIQGFRLEAAEAVRDNWFGSAHVPIYSKLTFAFVDEGKAKELLEAIGVHNREHAPDRPIRAFQMHVEKYI